MYTGCLGRIYVRDIANPVKDVDERDVHTTIDASDVSRSRFTRASLSARCLSLNRRVQTGTFESCHDRAREAGEQSTPCPRKLITKLRGALANAWASQRKGASPADSCSAPTPWVPATAAGILIVSVASTTISTVPVRIPIALNPHGRLPDKSVPLVGCYPPWS